MKGNTGTLKVALVVLALGMLVVISLGIKAGTAGATPKEISRDSSQDMPSEARETGSDLDREFPVPITPLSKTITPCRACHGPEKDFPVNFKRREDLLVHRNVKLSHGGMRVWCLDCHDPANRNYLLPLSDGKFIDFQHSYLLCGKCHGTKYRDWRNGIHGKRTGFWNGEKNYFLCVSCHDPHNPKFKPLEPMPPPAKPWTPAEKQTRH
jgi:hypothetical protein